MSSSPTGRTVTVFGRQVNFYQLLLATAPAPVAAVLWYVGNLSTAATQELLLFIQSPARYVERRVIAVVVNTVLSAAFMVGDLIVVTAVGGDRQLGPPAAGLVDFPLVGTDIAVAAFTTAVLDLLGGIQSLNEQFASAVAGQLGLTAGPVLVAVAVAELVVGAYVGNIVVRLLVAQVGEIIPLPLTEAQEIITEFARDTASSIREVLT